MYGVGFMPIGMLISSLNTTFPMVKLHFLTRNEMASNKVCLAKYRLPQPFDVQ